MAHSPDAGRSLFTDVDRILVRHRMLTECARHGASLDDFEVGGRRLPLSELVDRLVSDEPLTKKVVDQARLSTAWFRLHGHDGLARLIDVVSDVRGRHEAGAPRNECMARFWRFIELRTSADLATPAIQMNDFIRVHTGMDAVGIGRDRTRRDIQR